MEETQQERPNKILVFNPQKRLVAVYRSTYAVAQSFNVRIQSIQYACDGTCISCQGHYFRVLNENVLSMDQIIMDDFNILPLGEYDRLCGVERKLYRTGKMERKGMKYNKQPKESNK